MTIARPIALLLDLAALAFCLFALLIQPHVLSLGLALGFSTAIAAMIRRQPVWVAVAAALFCILVSAVCGVIGFEVLRTGDWYGTEAGLYQFLAALGMLGTAGPLITLYTLFRMYAGAADAAGVGY